MIIMSSGRPPIRSMVKEAVKDLGGNTTHKQIIDWINGKYDDVNTETIRAQTNACTVNIPSRIHMPECSRPREYDDRYDFLYSIGRGKVEFYDHTKHGKWTIMQNNNGKSTIAKDGVPLSDGSKPSLLKFLKDEMKMQQNYQPIVIKMLLEAKDTSSISTFKQASIAVLQQNGKPLHYKEITKKALEQHLIETGGKTPELSLLRDMSEDIRLNGKNAIFKKINEGVYGLNDYTSKSESTVTVKEIREKFAELNFGTDTASSINSVKGTLDETRELVDFTGSADTDTATLKLNVVNSADIPECLKICGQAIARWHIEKIVGDNFTVWGVLPGSRQSSYEYLDEFLESNSIGTGWNNFGDLSKFPEESDAKDHTKSLDPGGGQTATTISHKMKKKDIVVVTKGQSEIIDFGIITSDYEYVEKEESGENPSYAHRRNVVWLERGNIKKEDLPDGLLASFVPTVHPVKSQKQEMINVLLEEENQEYFLVRHNVKGKWKDDLGKKYHFGRTVPNYKKLLKAGVGTKTVWYTVSNGNYYFWGYGAAKEIEILREDEEWNLVYDNFTFFEDNLEDIEGKMLKRGSESIKQQIQNLPKFNNQITMFRVTKEIYEEITSDRSPMSTSQKQDTAELERLYQILQRKKQIILYGPPGTGKTYSANKLKEHILSKNAEIATVVKVGDGPDPSNPADAGETILDARNFFMINGPWAHLKHSLDNEPFLWASKGSDPSDIGVYNKLQTNDIIFFSNNTKDPGPFEKKVVFGFGRLVRKFEGTEPYWPDEIEENKVIYKYRFEIKILSITYEPSKAIEWIKGLPYTKGFNSVVNEDVIRKLIAKIDRQWVDSKDGNRAIQDIKHDVDSRPRSIVGADTFSKNVTFHQSYSYEDFVEGIRPKITDGKVVYEPGDGIFKQISNDARKDPDNKYVLLIDEINRGNIEKIFGELITLIEADKRSEVHKATLPYTREPFWVPENLFIIGTMNTADRSIAQIDTALRRRFAFEELMPMPELVGKEIDGISLQKLLEELNNKIRGEGIALRDKQIGHSYFMKVKNLSDLRITFAVEIVPLLQDYFYSDYKKLADILSPDFIDSEKMMIKEKWQKDDASFKTAINNILGQ